MWCARHYASLLIAAVVGTGLGLGGGVAHAQMPSVDPGGAVEAPPPAAPAPTPQPIIVPLQPGQTVGEGEAEPDRWYQTDVDADWDKTQQQWNTGQHGPVPEHHVVRRGDTLWDISWIYFNNPWVWPKVWSYNPAITNPHWIYPGDLVRLYAKGEALVVVEDVVDPVDVSAPTAINYDVALRHIAFVDRDKLKYAAVIDGSVDAKEMLSVGDHVYLSYEGKPPKVGRRYAIYTERQPVKHPKSKKAVGSYVKLLGELTVLSVKKEKRARAVIEEAVDVVERGALVGPLQRSFRGDDVDLVPNEQDLQGTIVAMLAGDQLIGNGQVVFVDLGAEQGVKKGNLLHAVRRGDAYEKVMDPKHNVGQDDSEYPSRSIGRIVVVQVGKTASIGLVISSSKEFGIGDFVIMRAVRE